MKATFVLFWDIDKSNVFPKIVGEKKNSRVEAQNQKFKYKSSLIEFTAVLCISSEKKKIWKSNFEIRKKFFYKGFFEN